MGVLRRVLAGLATGAGTYLIEKGKQDAQALRDQILMNRELALKKLEHDYRVAEGKQNLANQKELGSHMAGEQRTTDKNKGDIETVVGEKADKRKGDLAVRLSKMGIDADVAKRQWEKNNPTGKVVDVTQDENGEQWAITDTNGKVGKVRLGVKSKLPESADGIYPEPASSGSGSFLDAALNNGGGGAPKPATGAQDTAYDKNGVAYTMKNGKWVDAMGRPYPGS